MNNKTTTKFTKSASKKAVLREESEFDIEGSIVCGKSSIRLASKTRN